jgi:hypothetical protein
MNVKAYFRTVSNKDGKFFIKVSRDLVAGLGFIPNEIVIVSDDIRSYHMTEVIAWIEQHFPDTKYDYAYEGLDWFFEDPTVAVMFKLRWC